MLALFLIFMGKLLVSHHQVLLAVGFFLVAVLYLVKEVPLYF